MSHVPGKRNQILGRLIPIVSRLLQRLDSKRFSRGFLSKC